MSQTLVFFHAHPDDEASQTAGSMVRAVQQGHRVVVVYATNGDHGTVPMDLADGETVVDRRRAEAEKSARIIGTAAIHWLGYRDSGMTGWDQNGDPNSFAQADAEEAAGRLAGILDAEDADVLVGYDWHGNYGHPDHIKVHEVTHRAARLAARAPRVLEETTNADDAARLFARAKAMGLEFPGSNELPDGPEEMLGDDGLPTGLPESELHWRVDVTDLMDRKRAALAAHASQADTQWMLSLPPQALEMWLGFEHFREPGRDAPMVSGWPFGSQG